MNDNPTVYYTMVYINNGKSIMVNLDMSEALHDKTTYVHAKRWNLVDSNGKQPDEKALMSRGSKLKLTLSGMSFVPAKSIEYIETYDNEASAVEVLRIATARTVALTMDRSIGERIQRRNRRSGIRPRKEPPPPPGTPKTSTNKGETK